MRVHVSVSLCTCGIVTLCVCVGGGVLTDFTCIYGGGGGGCAEGNK